MTRNRVLIPLDGSAFSETILPVVRRYLRPEENELILYQVVEPPDGGSGGIADLVADRGLHNGTLFRLSSAEVEQAMHPIYASQVEDGLVAEQEARLLPTATQLRADGYTVSTEIGLGDPARTIEKYIRYHNIDLVAMTTHGRTGLQRTLTGTVAGHMLRHLAVPILLLHPLENEAGG